MPKSPHQEMENLPGLINQLIFEHQAYLRKIHELTEQIVHHESHFDNQTKIILAALSEESLDQDDLQKLKPEFKNMVNDYVAIRKKLGGMNQELNALKADIERMNDFVHHYDSEDFEVKLSPEVSKLKESVGELVKSKVKNSHVDLIGRIKKGLTGEKGLIPEELENLINELIIARLEELVEPYDNIAYKLTHGEIDHEQYIESLKKKALVEQMRAKLIADVTHAINQRNLNESSVPSELKKAIENLVRDQINYVMLLKERNNSHLAAE